jgi:TolA-binding protein
MRKNTLILTMIAVMMFCFMSIAQAQSGNDTVAAQDVKKETQELINTLQQYTADQRDQAVKEADQSLKKLDGRIDKLESRVDNNWDKMTQAARQKARANLKALRQQRNELAEWYGSFKNSSAGAWEQMKKGFSDSYQAMSASWEKAKSEYDTDNK